MTRASTARTPTRAAATEAAREALDAFAAVPPDTASGTGHPTDPGPAVLAALVAGTDRPTEGDPATRAVAAWVRRMGAGMLHPGLFGGGGLAGCYVGAHVAAGAWPDLARLAASLRSMLVAHALGDPWARQDIGWSDYDLVTGPSGTLLALSCDPPSPAPPVAPIAAHLTALCGDGLAGLRVGAYRGEELRGWNHGRINTGLAHGVTGVAAALRAADRLAGPDPARVAAERRIARWLTDQCHTDTRHVRTWASAGTDGRPPPTTASPRQAWCYGTPGIAWTLWETGRALHDPVLRTTARQAFASFVAAYDDAFYLAPAPGEDTTALDTTALDTLALCHGAAGLLLIADAFARHTGLPGSADLRDHLEQHLLRHLDETVRAASADPTLLSGAGGVLAALLTLSTGNRAWLPSVALR